MQQHEVVLSSAELDAFFRFVDDNSNGRIDILEFQDNVLPLGNGISQLSPTRYSPSRHIASPSRYASSQLSESKKGNNGEYYSYLARSNSPSRRKD